MRPKADKRELDRGGEKGGNGEGGVWIKKREWKGKNWV